MKKLAQVEHYLRNVMNREDQEEIPEKQVEDTLEEVKRQAVKSNNQETAKLIWCYKQILEIQDSYLLAFRSMRSGSYYSAWRLLERIEILLSFLEQHFASEEDENKLHFIEKHVKQFQSLFPYKLFLSPAIFKKNKVCSTCGSPVSIRNPCGHRVGEIYDGEMCCRITTEAEVTEISFVGTPGHKYSVLFIRDSENDNEITDHYNYTFVRYVVDGLRSPFDAWDMRWTKRRHPHSRYEHIGQDENCPCESDKHYRDCCLPELGVLRPHLDIFFHVSPPMGLLEIQYTD